MECTTDTVWMACPGSIWMRMGFRLIKASTGRLLARATVAHMFTASGLITLIVAALIGTIIGNLVQLRYFMDKPIMKSPFIRYGALVVAVLVMINVMPDRDGAFTTEELLTTGLWWVLIAFLVSFVRPPAPLTPPAAGQQQASGQESAGDEPQVHTLPEDDDDHSGAAADRS